jgi:membrane-bound inhibitor of C-type lysozyme
MRISLLVIAGAALAACSTTSPPPAASGRNTQSVVAYGCENGMTFAAAFMVGDAVELRMADGTKFSLPQVNSASGARFADARHEFWVKGDEAMYTIGKAMPTTCRVAK